MIGNAGIYILVKTVLFSINPEQKLSTVLKGLAACAQRRIRRTWSEALCAYRVCRTRKLFGFVEPEGLRVYVPHDAHGLRLCKRCVASRGMRLTVGYGQFDLEMEEERG